MTPSSTATPASTTAPDTTAAATKNKKKSSSSSSASGSKATNSTVKSLDGTSGTDYSKKSSKLPKTLGTGGKAPPVTAHVYGASPPDALTCAVYRLPIFAGNIVFRFDEPAGSWFHAKNRKVSTGYQ